MSASSEESTLIERLIAASARNKFLIVIFTIFGVAAGIFALPDTAGRDSRPERRASNRLYRLGRTLARPRRRPDYLSDLHALHRRAEG